MSHQTRASDHPYYDSPATKQNRVIIHSTLFILNNIYRRQLRLPAQIFLKALTSTVNFTDLRHSNVHLSGNFVTFRVQLFNHTSLGINFCHCTLKIRKGFSFSLTVKPEDWRKGSIIRLFKIFCNHNWLMKPGIEQGSLRFAFHLSYLTVKVWVLVQQWSLIQNTIPCYSNVSKVAKI